MQRANLGEGNDMKKINYLKNEFDKLVNVCMLI